MCRKGLFVEINRRIRGTLLKIVPALGLGIGLAACGAESEREVIGFSGTSINPTQGVERTSTPTPIPRDQILNYVLSKGKIKNIDVLKEDVEKLWRELLAGKEGVAFARAEMERWSREAFEQEPQNLNDNVKLANVGFINRRIFGLGMIGTNAARAYCSTGDEQVFRTYADVAATMNAQIAFFAALGYTDKTDLLSYYLIPQCLEEVGQKLLQQVSE